MTTSPRICPACSTSNPPQAAFCFGCGKPLGQVSATSELLHQRYHLLHQLGSGGFGAVYQAEDTQLGGRLVAVKEMSPQSKLSAQENVEATEGFKKSDIYSLGATLHQMLTGIDPSLNPFRFAPLRLPAGRPTPKALAALVARMVEMDEMKRPSTMQAVKIELQEIAARVASGSFAIVKSSLSSPQPVPAPVVQPEPDPGPPPPTYGVLRCMHKGLHQSVRTLGWSPDSKLLISAGNGNVLDIWDAASGDYVREYRNHGGSIRMVLWSPNGKYIASASEDKTVHIWEVDSGRAIQIYRGHSHLVTGLGWSPDSRCVASSSIDKSVQIWDISRLYLCELYPA